MRPTLFSDLKSLSTLRQLSPENKELLALMEVIIDGDNEASLRVVVEKSMEKMELDDLFQLSEGSPKIRALFESEEYESLWHARLAFLDCELKQETTVPVFQQLMGSYLAFFYHKWVKAGKGTRPAAHNLLDEVERRGVQNPITSEIAYTLAALPMFTSAVA